MEAYPINNLPHSLADLETNLYAFSEEVKSSICDETFSGQFNLGLEMSPHIDNAPPMIPMELQSQVVAPPEQWPVVRDGSSKIPSREIAYNMISSNISRQSQDLFSAAVAQQIPAFSSLRSNTSMASMLQSNCTTIEAPNKQIMPTCMHGKDRSTRSHRELLRRGSIRKRNVKRQIPQGRNLHNIDDLISQSTNELEIRELKKEKRLLRNRQAALDSRQRKKDQMKQLEEENKELESFVDETQAKLKIAEGMISDFADKESQWRRYTDSLQLQKEQMLRQHHVECVELRHQISELRSRLETKQHG